MALSSRSARGAGDTTGSRRINTDYPFEMADLISYAARMTRIWFADVLSSKTIRPRRFRWLVFHSDDDLASSPAGGHHVVGFG
jgi:hypothetical protein